MRHRRYASLAYTSAALVLLVAGTALAQSSTTTAVGSCTGGITATVGFGARTDSQTSTNQPTPISQTFAPYAFGRAECDCDPSEASGDAIYMVLQVSMGFSQGTQATPTAWVGAGCDVYTTRINTSAVSCRQFSPMNLDSTSFTAGSGNIGVSVLYDLWVPARELFSPETGQCDTNGANNIYIFLGNDQTMPDATCTVNLAEQATPPSPAVNPTAQSGDSAITVAWSAPTLTNTTNLITPSYYQILCANSDGSVFNATKKPDPPAYSTCQLDGIHRRQNIFGATEISGVGDGGVTPDDLSFPDSAQLSLPRAFPAISDAGVDGGVTDASTTNADLSSNPTDTTPHVTSFPGMDLGVFATLDPKYICSNFIDATTTTSFSQRITGLVNNQTYQFLVVAIDQYGNASPTPLLTGIPKPVEDLYGAYREAGGTAHGFCFVATAAFGDYDHPMVRILREFRDRVLESTTLGHGLVRAYYATSPPLARFIARSDGRRFVARVLLWPMVGIAQLALALHSLLLALLALGMVAGAPLLLLWRRRRRKQARLIEVTA